MSNIKLKLRIKVNVKKIIKPVVLKVQLSRREGGWEAGREREREWRESVFMVSEQMNSRIPHMASNVNMPRDNVR